MSKDKILCKCKKTTEADVLKAIKQGATSYKEVKKMTKAASKCGKCKEQVKKFVKKNVE